MSCEHPWKFRLAGLDARLWQCADDGGCGLMFVEGRVWKDEPAWLSLGVTSRFDICCRHCLDGFCTSVDLSPCERCGRGSARSGGVA